MNKQAQITTQLYNETSEAWEQLLLLFSDQELNQLPFEGSWTAGQLVDHVDKATNAYLHLVAGAGKAIDRNPAMQIEAFQQAFAGKQDAPDFLLPSEKNFTKQDLLNQLHNTNAKVQEAITTYDLSETIIDFDYDGLGEVTRFELISFAILHMQRHINQLEQIRNRL